MDNIIPLSRHLKLDIPEVKIGAIQSDALSEHGTILAVAKDCTLWNDNDIGTELYFKAWAVNVITVGDIKHYFIREDSEAICGKA